MISQTLRPTSNGYYDQLPGGDGSLAHWEMMADQSYSTTLYAEVNTWKIGVYNIANPTRIGSVKKVTVWAEAGHGNGYVGAAYGKTALYISSTVYYGTQIYFGSSGNTYYDISTEYVTNPATGNPWTWAEVDAIQSGVALRLDSTGGYTVVREVWIVVESGIAGADGAQIIGLGGTW